MSTIGCQANEVSIYDSKLRKTKVHPHVTKQIASFCHTKGPHLKIRIMHSQGQSGGSDCGLFAIATATSLCYGIPPSTVLWDQNRMRKHLVECLESGKMVPFSAWDLPQQQEVIQKIEDEPVLETLKIKVYCSCWTPQGRDKMAQCTSCKEWYHQQCENIPFVRNKRLLFICHCCK